MEELSFVLNNAERIGVLAMMLLFLLGLHRRVFVLGWTYEECVKDRDRYGDDLDRKAVALETKLDRLEQQRDGR